MRPGIGALLYASSLLAHKGGKTGEQGGFVQPANGHKA